MVNILFILCGGKTRKALYEISGQKYKAMIEVEKGRPLFTYAVESAKKCRLFDKKFILAPAEIKGLVEKECSFNGLNYLPSCVNMSGTLKKCWITLREQYPDCFGEQPNVHVTFLYGDAVFIESETIDTFSSEAANKKASLVFQAIDARDIRGFINKKINFLFLKNLSKEITGTNLVEVNITKKQTADSIESLLFRQEYSRIIDECYFGLGNGAKRSLRNFVVSAYKMAIKKTSFPKATSLLIGAFYRFLNDEFEEDYIKDIFQSIIGLDACFVFTTNPLDKFDVDWPTDLQFARSQILIQGVSPLRAQRDN